MTQRILSLVRENLRLEHGLKTWISKRGIAASTSQCAKKMPDRPKPLDEEDFMEAFLKGSGPGGQKIVSGSELGISSVVEIPCCNERKVTLNPQNKTSSAVQLKHIPTGMVLKVQATRSRTQNRKIARQMLAERVEELEKGKESRVAVVGEAKRQKKARAVKKSKKKYRLLGEAKAKAAQEAREAAASGEKAQPEP
jgi:protein subunit release factor B